MKREDLNNYPEYPSKEIVERFCNFVLDEADKFVPEDTLGDLNYLGDKQWHTYELPSKVLQERITNWLIQNWTSNSNKFLEGVMGVCYCFALDKEIVQKALELYDGEFKQEYKRHLDKSLGDNMDPWWSMKE